MNEKTYIKINKWSVRDDDGMQYAQCAFIRSMRFCCQHCNKNIFLILLITKIRKFAQFKNN